MDKNIEITTNDNKIPQEGEKKTRLVVVAKKKIDDATIILEKTGEALVKNISENSKAYSDTFNSILTAWKDCSVKARDIELEITKMNASHQNTLEKMDIMYQQRKSTISELQNQIKGLQNQLKKVDISTLTDEGHKTYRFLVEQMSNMSMMLIKIYDTIM